MFKVSRSLLVLATAVVAPSFLLAEKGFLAPNALTVGRNLQTFGGVRLTEPAPEGGLTVTVTSDDPNKMLLSLAPNEPGKKSITVKVNPKYVETPDFCVHGMVASGSTAFTASAADWGSVKGNVVLTPSAILMAGPFKVSAFESTPATPSKLTLYSAAVVDKAGTVVQQPVGANLNVNVDSSDPKIGATTSPSVMFNAGEASAVMFFQPAGSVGSTTLSMKVPSGFVAPPKMATVIANISYPGIAISGEVNLGKDLQLPGNVLLGEAAPEGGLDVTLVSEDPKKMLISTNLEETGAGTVVVHIPAGEQRGKYYLQALSESGTIYYSASAPNYRGRRAPIYLAPSGILLVYKPYGAPDRAEVQRDTRDARPFSFPVSSKTDSPFLTLWVVFLDRDTHRGADITVQALRPGISPVVELRSSNPEVGTVPIKVKIESLKQDLDVQFEALKAGKTTFSVVTPEGFTTPSNAHSVDATFTK